MNSTNKKIGLSELKEKIAQYFELSHEESGVFSSGDPLVKETYIQSISDNKISQEFYQLVKNYIDNPKEVKIVDMGCGLGGFLVACQENGVSALGVEIDPQAAEIAKFRIGNDQEVIVADAENLPLADNSFDLATSITVIEHVKNPEQYFKEAYRVLKNNGKLIIMAPNNFFPWEGHYQSFWLPYLSPFTKPLYKLYLKLKKRNPKFVDFVNFKITFGFLKKRLKKAGFTKINNLSMQRFKNRIENPDLITNPKPKKLMKQIKKNKLLFSAIKLILSLIKILQLYHPIILVAEKNDSNK